MGSEHLYVDVMSKQSQAQDSWISSLATKELNYFDVCISTRFWTYAGGYVSLGHLHSMRIGVGL